MIKFDVVDFQVLKKIKKTAYSINQGVYFY